MSHIAVVFHFQVSAVNKYDPPLEVIAARDHMTHLMYQLMQPQVIFDRCDFSIRFPLHFMGLSSPHRPLKQKALQTTHRALIWTRMNLELCREAIWSHTVGYKLHGWTHRKFNCMVHHNSIKLICIFACYSTSTLPSLDAPYPMLVLTGPQACGKRELAHKLCQEFRDYFAYG